MPRVRRLKRRAIARVSLVDELSELAALLESGQLLAELMSTHGLPDEAADARAPQLLEAILAMAHGRVQLLRKVVLQEARVSLLAGRHNVRPGPPLRGDDPDVTLTGAPELH